MGDGLIRWREVMERGLKNKGLREADAKRTEGNGEGRSEWPTYNCRVKVQRRRRLSKVHHVYY